MQVFRMLCPPQVNVSKFLLHHDKMKLFKRIKQMSNSTKYFKQVVDTDVGL